MSGVEGKRYVIVLTDGEWYYADESDQGCQEVSQERH